MVPDEETVPAVRLQHRDALALAGLKDFYADSFIFAFLPEYGFVVYGAPACYVAAV